MVSADKRAELERAARLHYEHGLTHQAVADFLGVSRVKVTRMLGQAREEGLVRIRVLSDTPLFDDLGALVKDAYGLSAVWIAPSRPTPEATRESVAMVGAHALQAVIRPKSVVAVALSHTLAESVQLMDHRSLDVLVVPATGQLAGTADGTAANEVSISLATACHGRAMRMAVPMLANTPEAAEVFREDAGVRMAIEQLAKADLLIAGLGSLDSSGLLINELDEAEKVSLRAAGAVGDVAACYFDKHGKPVVTPGSSRLITASLENLLRIPERLVMTYGEDRLEALHVAATHRLMTMLVTDKTTAEQLLARQATPGDVPVLDSPSRSRRAEGILPADHSKAWTSVALDG